MITIPQPSMALNAVDVPGAKFKMWNTWDVPGHETPDHIMQWSARVAATAQGGYLRARIINCHGYYGRDGNGRLVGGFGVKLGKGIYRADTRKFSALKGKVRGIIITACGTARIALQGALGDGDGHAFCREIAQHSGAYVFAGTTHQQGDIWLPFGKIDDFEGLVVGYSPRGEMIWSRDYGRGFFDGVINGYD